jgi:hypothetical protein
MRFTVSVESDPGVADHFAVAIRDHAGNLLSYPARRLTQKDAGRYLMPIRHAFMAGMSIMRAESVGYLNSVEPSVMCSLTAKDHP